jgi:hypothetical protein
LLWVLYMLNPQPFERIIVATCTLFLDSWDPFDGQSSNFGLEGISGSINIATGTSGNAPNGIISIRSRDAVLHQPGRIDFLVGTGGCVFVRSGFSLFQSSGDVMAMLTCSINQNFRVTSVIRVKFSGTTTSNIHEPECLPYMRECQTEVRWICRLIRLSLVSAMENAKPPL